MLFVNIRPMRIILSTCGILYVWSLPLLSIWGFAESNGHSISAFIANPPATGAMAAISFMPLTLMWEYQDAVLNTYHYNNNQIKNNLYYSLCSYQIFYGCFLICTETYYPEWMHISTVSLFGASFLVHQLLTFCYINQSVYTKGLFCIGLLSFISLLFVKHMWFWAMECIGFTCMLLFTPMQWITYIESNEDISLTRTVLESN